MEAAIRAFLRDPVFGIPVLLLLLVLVAHIAVYLRSVAAGATPIIPSLKVMATDVAIVLLVALMFIMTKAMDLFVPEDGTTVGGVDVAPLFALLGPLVFGSTGLALAVWLVKKKLEALATSAAPPA